jgi:cell division protein FtsL
VHTQYESRRLFVELDKAQAAARKLEVDHERLQVEKRAQATPLRVERLAKEQLQMRVATPAITQYVAYSAAAAKGNAGVIGTAPAAATTGGNGQ